VLPLSPSLVVWLPRYMPQPLQANLNSTLLSSTRTWSLHGQLTLLWVLTYILMSMHKSEMDTTEQHHHRSSSTLHDGARITICCFFICSGSTYAYRPDELHSFRPKHRRFDVHPVDYNSYSGPPQHRNIYIYCRIGHRDQWLPH